MRRVCHVLVGYSTPQLFVSGADGVSTVSAYRQHLNLFLSSFYGHTLAT